MDSRRLRCSVALVALLGVCLVASKFSLGSLWSLNFYAYLPGVYWYVAGILAIASIALVLPVKSFDRIEEMKFPFSFPWDWSIWKQVVTIVVLGAIFYLLRLDIFLYGDGYHVISDFAQQAKPIHRWTEPFMVPVVRAVQRALGDPSANTAQQAFQILSVVSGSVVLLNYWGLVRSLAQESSMRWLVVVTLTFSGTIVFFLGYVEYYPIASAAMATFVNFGVRFLIRRESTDIVVATLAFLIGSCLHLALLALTPGIVFLWFLRVSCFMRTKPRTLLAFLLIALSMAIGGSIIWKVVSDSTLQRIFLPLLNGRLRSPDYAILSTKHLLDILNLATLVFPCWIALVTLAIGMGDAKERVGRDGGSIRLFFAWTSLGPMIFLFIVDPLFGMAIDWDLMALTLFVPGLWLLYEVTIKRSSLPGRVILAYALSAAVVLIGFVGCMYNQRAATARFRSALDYYGTKNRGGWYVLYNFCVDRGNEEGRRLALEGISRWFPEEALLPKAYAALDRADYTSARSLALQMVQVDPERADYLQAAAKAYRGLGLVDSAAVMYRKALHSRPLDAHLRNEYGQLLIAAGDFSGALDEFRKAQIDDPTFGSIREGIALVYVRTGHLGNAQLVADSLLMTDKNSPGGHLISMIVALGRADTSAAQGHFSAFSQFGSGRSDFNSITSYYNFLRSWHP
jgi:tetratricopeptide (TPR) repeat protein